MANNTTLPGTGETIEDIDIGSGVKRQVVTISDRAGGAVDVIGGLSETAPSTDTASSGLNGRLQRIAQRLSSLIGRFMSTTATLANVTAATSSTAILAANANRVGASVLNDSTATLYLKLGASGAATTSCTLIMAPGSYYEVPGGYTGAICGIWSAANGAARVTELT